LLRFGRSRRADPRARSRRRRIIGRVRPSSVPRPGRSPRAVIALRCALMNSPTSTVADAPAPGRCRAPSNSLDPIYADRVPDVLERAPQSRVAPAGVPRRHLHQQSHDLRRCARPTWSAARAAVVLLGDQLSVPPKNGVRRGNRGHLAERCGRASCPKREASVVRRRWTATASCPAAPAARGSHSSDIRAGSPGDARPTLLPTPPRTEAASAARSRRSPSHAR
jgi:hypothetical protein